MAAQIARPPRAWATAAALGAALTIGACGATTAKHPAPAGTITTVPGLAADAIPVPAGRGSEYRLPPTSPPVAHRANVAGLRCLRAHPHGYGAHVELYARRLVLPLPAGVGVAPPVVRRGAYVIAGACSYSVRTFEPTGVIVVDSGRTPNLASLFALWGQPLSANRLAGFRGRVLAFVGGRRWQGPPGSVPLRRHAEIVLQVGGALPPHTAYRFPPGL